MQLTRNNYEEYFLLYIDGELSKADQEAVAQFVKLHPDLEEELQLLQESILPLDGMIEMPGKERMMKQVEWQEAELSPARQQLMLYLDNELDTTEKAALKIQLEKNPVLQNDLQSLQKARLDAELIAMPGKESMYRYERDRKPIPIRLVRWVAAAATIAGIGWFSISMFNMPDTDTPEVANVLPVKNDRNTVIAPDTDAMAVNDRQATDAGTPTSATDPIVESRKQSQPQQVYTVASYQEPVKSTSKQPDQPVVLTTPAQELAVVLPPTGIKETIEVDRAKITAPDVEGTMPVYAVNSQPPAQTKQPQQATSPFKFASYGNDMEEESEYVNIAGAHINKQKLRGLFRNVSRTVTRGFDKSTVTQANVSSL